MMYHCKLQWDQFCVLVEANGSSEITLITLLMAKYTWFVNITGANWKSIASSSADFTVCLWIFKRYSVLTKMIDSRIHVICKHYRRKLEVESMKIFVIPLQVKSDSVGRSHYRQQVTSNRVDHISKKRHEWILAIPWWSHSFESMVYHCKLQ